MSTMEALVMAWIAENGFPTLDRRVFGGTPIMTYKEFMEHPLDEELFAGGAVHDMRKRTVMISCANCGGVSPGWFVDLREEGIARRRQEHVCL